MNAFGDASQKARREGKALRGAWFAERIGVRPRAKASDVPSAQANENASSRILIALALVTLFWAVAFLQWPLRDLVVPWVTYTDPEVAATGLSLADARAAGHDDARSTRVELESVDRARLDGEPEGFLEVVHTKRGRVLGGTLVGAHAGESISELTLAITQRASLGALASVIHPYPTVAEVFRKAGDAFNRTRLTPFTAKVLRWLARR